MWMANKQTKKDNLQCKLKSYWYSMIYQGMGKLKIKKTNKTTSIKCWQKCGITRTQNPNWYNHF